MKDLAILSSRIDDIRAGKATDFYTLFAAGVSNCAIPEAAKFLNLGPSNPRTALVHTRRLRYNI